MNNRYKFKTKNIKITNLHVLIANYIYFNFEYPLFEIEFLINN